LNENIILQIKQIDNKIQRLESQKNFYLEILNLKDKKNEVVAVDILK